jgi:hypothetical protein
MSCGVSKKGSHRWPSKALAISTWQGNKGGCPERLTFPAAFRMERRFSLWVIFGVTRHGSLGMTAHYAKVDIAMLEEIA